jgi:ribonucleoside-diphosphate reductase alpha chain
MASGGRSRRAAKMVTMLIDHPDIYEQAVTRPDGTPIEGFIRIKVRAEDIGRVLRDAGFDMDVSSGTDAIHLQYQNANLSVRVTNDFMEAVQSGGRWKTVPRRPDLVWKETPEYDAKFLWTEIARAAHACADPGLQFDTTINHWHSTPAAGRIDSSNPCSEYLHIDNSPCNLAATNLLKFLEDSGGFSVERYIGAVSMLTISQTILAVHGDYPTPRITQVARGFRQIGQGYTNNGAFLMAKGLPYDHQSDAGNDLSDFDPVGRGLGGLRWGNRRRFGWRPSRFR